MISHKMEGVVFDDLLWSDSYHITFNVKYSTTYTLSYIYKYYIYEPYV
jgi:hypothetical protein